MPVTAQYREPGAYTTQKADTNAPALPSVLRKLALIGKGKNYYDITSEEVTRGTSANGTDELTHTGIMAISNIADEFGVVYTQGASYDYQPSGRNVSWAPTGTGSLGTAADNVGSTMAAKVHVTRDGGESLSSDVYLVQCNSVGVAGTGKFDVHSLIEGITATAVASGTTRTDIVPGVQLYVQDTTGSTIGHNCSFTAVAGYNANEPDAGVKYYVDYTYAKVEADYEPKTFYKFGDVMDEYGADSADNTLTIGARIAFEHNAGAVVCVPVYGLSGGEPEVQVVAAYRTAIDKLEGEDVQLVVPLHPSATLAAYLKSHVVKMSTTVERKERRGFVGADVDTTIAQFITNAKALAHLRTGYVACDGATKTIGSTTYTLDGSYLAAAIGGCLTDPNYDVSTSRTRFQIIGFDALNTKYLRSEANNLASNGLTVMEDINGSVRIRHLISTSTATVNAKEWVVQDTADYVALATRTALEAIYVPFKIDSELPAQVAATTKVILNNLVRAKLIKSWSNVSAEQDSGDATIINVVFSFYPMYPCNIIDICFSISSTGS